MKNPLKYTEIFIIFIVLLSSCGSLPKTKWVKSGATQTDYNKDSYECYKDVMQSNFVGHGMTQRCMIAKGWELVPVR